MSAQKKFKNNYPLESKKPAAKKPGEVSNIEDKKLIKAYLEKIGKLLEDPEKQKKAADILTQLINNKK